MSAKKNSISPSPVKTKLTLSQLQEKVEQQGKLINQLRGDAVNKDVTIKSLELMIHKLEGKVAFNSSLLFVRDRIANELKSQLNDLQQYTRRYSVVISGVKKGTNEKEEVREVLNEVESNTSMVDVDKFHRVGPIKNNKQDIIVRFKTHSAKEEFFLHRKSVKKHVKIGPSLAPGRKALLEKARVLVDEYNDSTTLRNPPHFVYADMNGKLFLKMMHKVNNKNMFFKFSSILDLVFLIENNQGSNENVSGNGTDDDNSDDEQ